MLKIDPSRQFTFAAPQSAIAKIIQFPLVRLLIAALFMLPVLALDKSFKMTVISPLTGSTQIVFKYIEAVIFFVLFMLAYRFYVRSVEKRPVPEISIPGWLNEFGLGFLISMALVVITVAFLYFMGYLSFIGIAPNERVALDLAVKFAMGAFMEEIFFRLLLFRLTEELLGTWTALIIQAAFFGFAHQANENATMVTSLSLIIVGGLFYTAAYIYTRRIWLPLGIHMAWNYFQSGIFSMPNSGSSYNGLIITKVSGPSQITGGSFGIEASFIAIALCMVAGLILTWRAGKTGQFVPPIWKREGVLASLSENC